MSFTSKGSGNDAPKTTTTRTASGKNSKAVPVGYLSTRLDGSRQWSDGVRRDRHGSNHGKAMERRARGRRTG